MYSNQWELVLNKDFGMLRNVSKMKMFNNINHKALYGTSLSIVLWDWSINNV